jgi:hypothetical protein
VFRRANELRAVESDLRALARQALQRKAEKCVEMIEGSDRYADPGRLHRVRAKANSEGGPHSLAVESFTPHRRDLRCSRTCRGYVPPARTAKRVSAVVLPLSGSPVVRRTNVLCE